MVIAVWLPWHLCMSLSTLESRKTKGFDYDGAFRHHPSKYQTVVAKSPSPCCGMPFADQLTWVVGPQEKLKILAFTLRITWQWQHHFPSNNNTLGSGKPNLQNRGKSQVPFMAPSLMLKELGRVYEMWQASFRHTIVTHLTFSLPLPRQFGSPHTHTHPCQSRVYTRGPFNPFTLWCPKLIFCLDCENIFMI